MGTDRDWSAVEADDVARAVGTDPERGLTTQEAAGRLAADGPNTLTAARPTPAWRRLLQQVQDPLVYLLLVAVIVSLGVWIADGRQGWPYDAVVITIIVLVNAVLGFVQEARARDAVAALQRIGSVTATVVRAGVQTRVPSAEVVRGDVLLLEEGDAVCADARLVSAAALRLSEASLTGESEAVLKDAATLPAATALADRLDMVFRGTSVVQGSGRALVTATGMDTEMGRIAGLLGETTSDPTPLEREVARIGRMLGVAVVVIAVVVMGGVLLTSPITTSDDLVTVLMLGVSLAVAAVPEGLPAILAVVLALGVQRMARNRAIVKDLSSVETLGSASVICSDKTGTLTKGEMTIVTVVTASGQTRLTGVGYGPEGRVEDGGDQLVEGPLWAEQAIVLGGGALAGNAVLQHTGGEWAAQGDPTEVAFLVAERKLGIADSRAERFRRLGQVPFTSERKLMTSIEEDAEQPGRTVVVTKGAPDVLIERCTRVQVGRGTEPLDADRRAVVLADVERLADAALRTLAVAYRTLDTPHPPAGGESLENDLVFAGLVAMIDPPRPEAAQAVREAHRAGIRVIMITGDHPRTAGRIAADLGIVAAGETVLTGAQLERMSDEELRRAVRQTSVYARVSPAHKLRIVDALQDDGNVVAMTGDGVNDAPALKSADIGVAMGLAGTEVTKDAAAMILADDNFATIVEAVRQGRGIFVNIRTFLRYLLSSNMGEVLTVFLGVVLAGVIGLADQGAVVVPLLATQILWINLLTDTGPALALGLDPATDDVMNRPPRSVGDRIIDARMWAGVLLVGSVMAIATLVTIDLYLPAGLIEGTQGLDNARTAGFTVLVLAQLFNCFNARSETTSAFHHLFVNRWLWGAVGLSLAAPGPRRPPAGAERGVRDRPAEPGPVAGLRRHRQLGAVGRRAPQVRVASPG